MAETPVKPESKRLSLHSSLCSSKKKLAPRSSLQFKVGPQFTPTFVQHAILNSKGEQLTPVLTPRIDRGFERIDNEWVGYKRNYFTLVSSFYFENLSFLTFAADDHYTINPETNLKTKIKYFGIRLTSKCADDGTNVTLVQHTAKRDRGPQFEPPTHPAVPSDLPDHNVIREAANVRNTSKIAKLNRIFFFDRDDKSNDELKIKGLLEYPTDKIIKAARYERIQFSSSINYKKPALNNKRFKLIVELVGFIDSSSCLSLAYTETPPLIVRGRSPSNYQGREADQYQSDTQTSVTPTTLDSFDDFDTYQILKMATEDLEQSPTIKTQEPKKKRGRKPKQKTFEALGSIQGKVKKPKSVKTKKNETKDHKCKGKGKNRKITIDKENEGIKNLVDVELLKSENNEGSHILNFKLLYTPASRSNRSAEKNYEDLCDFDDSANLVDLFDTQMHYNPISEKPKFNTLLPQPAKELNPLAGFSIEAYENDFLQMKNRLENEKYQHDLHHEDFAKVNPSAMLGVDDYDDGPSFMSYI